MTLRDVLQIEIWSKRTTRRLMSGFLVVFGLWMLWGVGWAVWGSWVTPFEKRAIRNALTETAKVRQFRGDESDAYRAQVAKARSAVEVCRKREISSYDEQIVWLVELDLDSALDDERAWQRIRQIPDSNPRKQRFINALAESDRFMDKVIRDAVE